MNVMTRPGMGLDEFLIWEAEQEGKWEFDGTGPVEMTSGTLAHALIQANLIAALHKRLEGTPFQVFGSELKIHVDGHIRYPKAFVKRAGGLLDSTVVHDPIVVFEVISPSTEQTDRFTKNREYAAIPSIQRYVMLEQGVIGATVFARTGVEWIGRLLLADAVLHMPEIGTEVPLAEFYTGLFPAA